MVAVIQATQAAHPDIVQHLLDRQELPGPRDVGGQGLRQRRDRRAGARGPLRFAPPRPRAPLARAEPRAPALADRRLRHEHADHEHREHPRDLDRVRGEPRRRRVRPDRRALPRVAQEPPAERRARPRSGTDLNRNYGYQLGCCGGSSGNEVVGRPTAARAAFSAPETRAMRDFMASRRIGGASRSRPRSRSTPPASRSSGRTATRRRTSRAT